MRSYHLVATMLLLLVAWCPSIHAESTTAPASRDAVPLPDDGVIRSPGAYFLEHDLSVDRPIGIDIKADDVSIDFRGHALRYTAEPKPGTLGVKCDGRRNVQIFNGAIGGSWFNIQCTTSQRVRISDIRFDDIVYIGVNVARSKDVSIRDNAFTRFRYDVKRDAKSHYVIGVNVSSDAVVIANNRFLAEPPKGSGPTQPLETVFVLFRPSRQCVVAHNDMQASEALNRSYGIWVASNAEAAIFYNRVRNAQFGVTIAPDGSAAVGYNQFTVDAGSAGSLETVGVTGTASKSVVQLDNTFDGLTTAVTMIQPAPTTQPN